MLVPIAQSNPFSWLKLQLDPPVSWAEGPVFWSVLAGIPVSIILLYFLKLRRRPLQVPSTFLWRQSIEDLHVNSLFQRLRRNLLLFLQLLAVFLVIFSLLGPQLQGSAKFGQRYILAIDNSASMSATDVRPSRLEIAKNRALKIVDSMGSGDLAMVISFSDAARVVSTYTGNKTQLRERIESIQPVRQSTSLREALEVAAGLANPSKQYGEGEVASEVQPPRLLIYTDGGFPDVKGFSLGNLKPELIVLGQESDRDEPNAEEEDEASAPPSNNIALLALQTARNEDQPDQLQLFGRTQNYRNEDTVVNLRLYRHELDNEDGRGRFIDAIELEIPARESRAFKFDLLDTGAVGLEVQLDVDDDLEQDNRAYAAIGRPRQARVLVVTPGNRYLLNALGTAIASDTAEYSVIDPDELETSEIERGLAAGIYDLIIFDRVRPKSPPACNTLYFGVMPPDPSYEEAERVQNPIILDWDIGHPMLQYIRDLSLVLVGEALVVEPPPGSSSLIESNQGTLGFVAPREGFSDAVVGFAIYNQEDKLNTTWQTLYSYPIFLFNSLRFLGNVQDDLGEELKQPGVPVVLRSDPTVDQIEVKGPDGRTSKLDRSNQGTFVFNGAAEPGLYRVSWDDTVQTAFAVNLFDSRESNIAPRGIAPEGLSETEASSRAINIGFVELEGQRQSKPARLDRWWWFALAALGILILEWYIYNRRVYI